MLSYRKTRDGSWAAFGPVAELRVGEVTVVKKDGSRKKENVVKVSNSFDVDGVPHAFGFIEKRSQGGSARVSGGTCAECGRPGKLVADLEDGLLKHYNCCDIPPGY